MSCFIANLVALSAVWRGGGPEHPDSGFMDVSSALQRAIQLVQEAKEHVLPRIPGQQTVDNLPPGPYDLRRNV